MMDNKSNRVYGKDPRYLTIRQLRKKKWDEHPIRTFFGLPVAFYVGLWKSLWLMGDQFPGLIAQCLTVFIYGAIFYTLAPFTLLLGVFMEGNWYRYYGFRPLIIGMGIGTFLVVNGTFPKQEFMLWNKIVVKLESFDISDSADASIGIVVALLFGIIILAIICIFLLCGACNHIGVAIVIILLFAEGCLAVRKSGTGMSDYGKAAWSWPARLWKLLWGELKKLFRFLRYYIPFYNLIVQDRDDYYYALMHHWL